ELLGEVQVGFARGENAIAHLRIGKALRIDFSELDGRALGANEVNRVDENRNIGVTGLLEQLECLAQRPERSVRAELDDRSQPALARYRAKLVERGAEPAPVRIVALRQRVPRAQLCTEGKRR